MKQTKGSTEFKLRNHHQNLRERAVIVSGGDGREGINVKVKRLDQEFATNGLPILNFEGPTKNSVKVITQSESDSDHQSEDPIEGAETLNLNNSV